MNKQYWGNALKLRDADLDAIKHYESQGYKLSHDNHWHRADLWVVIWQDRENNVWSEEY